MNTSFKECEIRRSILTILITLLTCTTFLYSEAVNLATLRQNIAAHKERLSGADRIEVIEELEHRRKESEIKICVLCITPSILTLALNYYENGANLQMELCSNAIILLGLYKSYEFGNILYTEGFGMLKSLYEAAVLVTLTMATIYSGWKHPEVLNILTGCTMCLYVWLFQSALGRKKLVAFMIGEYKD